MTTDPLKWPEPSSPAATAVMRANMRAGTTPEVAVRSELHRRGYRFRKDHMIRIGGRRTHPDIVFTRQRLAVYIDGCFWHRCPDHGTRPVANREYWDAKLANNVRRDNSVSMALRDEGWHVLRIWEHVGPTEAADSIESALQVIATTDTA